MSQPLFRHIAFIGFGLIGSSLARSVRRSAPQTRISVCARSAETLDTATRLGLADATFTDPAACVQGADLVVICTPIGAYKAIAEAIGGVLTPGTVVTDVGSVKSAVIRDVAPVLPEGVPFVPGHPIAGTEHSGPDAGFATLFENHWVILTPPQGTDPQAVERVADLWRSAGSSVEIMDAEHHDRVLAITSHLPHLIAYTIVGTATDLEEDTKREVIKFSAGGFRDFTRIAASDPVMWRDIFMNNTAAVLDILGRFTEDLTALQRAIRRGEGDTLQNLFTRTREIRRGVIDYRQDKIDTKTPDEA